jgi:hypothetical protein
MMVSKKLYFENAKEDELKVIKLFKAIPDTFNKGIVWRMEFESTV